MLRARGSGGPLTLQPTALVHEAFLKMAAQRTGCVDEAHFRALASIAMRRVLADHMRARSSLKRGGGRRGGGLCLDTLGSGAACDAGALHEALEELEAMSPRVATLVIYRFFGDLSVAEAAARLGISESTAEADWRFARVWLQDRMREIES
jgi:RNA polymerase sigma factor (TIGR02999 family)